MDWNQAENEVSLFYALRDHRPVGRDRFFHMYFILDQFSALTKKEVTSDVIWAHLREMYDLDALNQNENEAFDSTLEESEFQLPAEFNDLIAKKIQETDPSSLDKNDKEKEKEKDQQHKSSENEKIKEKDREADKDKDRDRELEKDRERKKLKVDESKDSNKDDIKTKDDPKKKDDTPGKLKATSAKKPEPLKNPSKLKIESNSSVNNKKEETPVKKKTPSLPSSPKLPAKKAKR